jgi:ATP-dependent DNA helicase DinG
MQTQPLPDQSPIKIAHDLITYIFEKILPRYDMLVRLSQVELAHRMLDTLAGRGIALYEAGVGIGKTFSYLIAAIAYQLCLPNEKGMQSQLGNQTNNSNSLSFVISTSSIALQQSIVDEYIPFLSSVLLDNRIIHKPINAVVRKGKSHFLCEKRLQQHLQDKNLNKQNPKQRQALLLLRQGTCDLDQITDLSDYDRQHVCVSECCTDKCTMRFHCRYFRYLLDAKSPTIHFQICNHHYLLADRIHRHIGKTPLLPDYLGLIIDEAHKLQACAQQMYGQSLSARDLGNLINNLSSLKNDVRPFLPAIKQIGRLSRELFDTLHDQALADQEGQTADFHISLPTRKLLFELSTCLTQLSRLLEQRMQSRLKSHVDRLFETVRLFIKPSPDVICQLTHSQQTNAAVLEAIPFDVGKQLCRDLWQGWLPAILTSGTLAVKQDFSAVQKKLGLDLIKTLRELDTYTARSPFDYRKNCLLYLPAGLPFADADDADYIKAIASQITDLVRASHGHTLVLFNSYRMMARVREAIDPDEWGFPLLVANKEVERTIGSFKAQKNAILFATGACWEGIDFPGDLVSSLIIVSLPFEAPNQVRRFEQLQYNCLQDYIQTVIVPAMQQKLKQGFGRTIRTETDTCVVSILDARALLGARYHRPVLDALPPCPLTQQIEDVWRFILSVKDEQYFCQ